MFHHVPFPATLAGSGILALVLAACSSSSGSGGADGGGCDAGGCQSIFTPHGDGAAGDAARKDAAGSGSGSGTSSGNTCNACLAGCQGMEQCCTGTGCMCESDCASTTTCPAGTTPKGNCDCSLEGDCMCSTICVSAATGSGTGTGGSGCSPTASVPASGISAYVPVVRQANACSASDLSSFLASCRSGTATQAACSSLLLGTAFAGCAGCLFPTTTNAGALLFDATGKHLVGTNQPGCLALADPTNGPACAAVLEPWEQCTYAACSSAACLASQTDYNACTTAADDPGGACYSRLAAAHNAACEADMASGGVLSARCNTDAEVLNAICGTGP